VAPATKPRYVDVNNPALAIDCPRCGLRTARFLEYCRNCGFHLWPSSRVASAAFQAWRDSDPARTAASRYDLQLPIDHAPVLVDYDERAHHLGIHIFPSSNFPFVISLGMFILALAVVNFKFLPLWGHIVIAVIGAAIFFTGVIGWVIVEDTRYYPAETADSVPAGHAHVEETA
jgi:ribosomal protein L37E